MVKRRYKKRKHNEEYDRKALRRYNKAVICYCPQVCPDVMRVQLSYQESFNLSGGALSTSDYIVMRGNSCFDPNLQLGGGQPQGFDQWSAFYRRYRVIASKIEARFGVDTGVIPFSGGICPSNSTSGISTSSQLQEQQYSKVIPLGNLSGTGQGTVTHYMTTDQMRGMPSGSCRINADLSALVNANPSNEWFWYVYAVADDGETTWTVRVPVKMTYYVEFYDRENLGSS